MPLGAVRTAVVGAGLLVGAAAVCAAGAMPLAEVGNLTAASILGWYAWHTASRTLPALLTAFREELAAARADARDDRQRFCRELAALRQSHAEESRAIAAALADLAARLDPVAAGR